MKSLKLLFLNLIFCFLAINCSSSDNTDGMSSGEINPLEAQELFNLPYGNDSKQVFDLYLPANRSINTKVIILVHGGSWVGGDKSDLNNLKNTIKEKLPELAIVNMNYRLANLANPPIPMQTDDISLLIDFVKENLSDYTISDNFGMIGTSAGGHLSMLWTYSKDIDANIKMVCSIVGPANFTDSAYTEDPDYDFLFAVFGQNLTTEFLEEASPFHQVTTSAPPTILFYGGQDPLVPTSQGLDLKEKLDNLGVINQFTLYEEEGHGWVGENQTDTENKLESFIRNHLINQ